MKHARALWLALLLALPASVEAGEPEVYFSPDDRFEPALVEALMAAKKSIDVAMYSIHPTSRRNDEDYARLKKEFGITALDAMREAHERGVRVRMVLSKATTYVWSVKAVAPLVEAGVEVYTTTKTMHEKYAIIDRSVVVNGSGNWSLGAFHRYHENWIVFPPDKSLAKAFQRDMDNLLSEKKRVIPVEGGKAKLKEKRPKKGERKTRQTQPKGSKVYFSGDNQGEKTTIVEDVLVEHMRKAKQSLQVAVAHYNSTRLADELIKAHERGIEVRVLVDLGEYNNRDSRAGKLAKAGVEVRYQTYSLKHHFPFAKLMHHKYMIVDGKTLLTGSYNWSRTAEHKNHENLQVLGGKAWAPILAAYQAELDRLWELGRERLPQFMKRLKAKQGSADYRRFIPAHFPTMCLTGKEIAAIRRVASKAGFFKRPKQGQKANWEFWAYDREERVGTNELPEPPHKPFFDLESLVISEVCYNPERQKSGEYVELFNNTSEPIDLAGYQISDGDATDTIQAYGKRTTVLKPGKLALIVDPDLDGDFKLRRGVVVVTVGNTTIGNGLAGDDEISLLSPKGKTLDTCLLEAKTAKGEAIQRKNVHLWSSPSNWEVAAASPGKRRDGAAK